MVKLLTYLLLFVLPLVVSPFGRLIFEPPKVLIAEVIIEILFIYLLLASKQPLKKINKPLIFLCGGLLLLSVIHIILDPSPQKLFGNIFRLQGDILLWHLIALTVIAQSIYFRLKDQLIYTGSFLTVSLFGVGLGQNSSGRFIGTLGEPNALASIVVFTFTFAYFHAHKTAKIALAVLALVVINFTESKSGLIALGVVILFLLLSENFKWKLKNAFFICLVIIILSLSLPFFERGYWLKNNTGPLQFKFEDRAEIWITSFYAGFDLPIYGSGFGSVQDKIKQTSIKLNNNAQYQIIDSSHNLLLDFWVQGGLAGLGLLLTLVILTFINFIKKGMLLELAAFLGVITVMLFNPVTVVILIAFFWLIGRSFANPKAE